MRPGGLNRSHPAREAPLPGCAWRRGCRRYTQAASESTGGADRAGGAQHRRQGLPRALTGGAERGRRPAAAQETPTGAGQPLVEEHPPPRGVRCGVSAATGIAPGAGQHGRTNGEPGPLAGDSRPGRGTVAWGAMRHRGGPPRASCARRTWRGAPRPAWPVPSAIRAGEARRDDPGRSDSRWHGAPATASRGMRRTTAGRQGYPGMRGTTPRCGRATPARTSKAIIGGQGYAVEYAVTDARRGRRIGEGAPGKATGEARRGRRR